MHLIFNCLVTLTFIGLVGLVYLVEAVLLGLALYRLAAKRPLGPLFRHPAALAQHLVALAGLGCILWGWLVEPWRLEVTTQVHQTPRLGRAEIRLVHFSDTHCDAKERLENRLTATVNSLRPDLVVFTGDALNDRAALDRFRRTLRGMRARLGKFAVPGNFDLSPWHRRELFADTGFVLLERDRRVLRVEGDRIVIHGLSCDLAPMVGEVARGADPGACNIFLTHTPNLVEDLPPGAMDLYLCGHTHGGQVALPWYGALITLSRHGKKYEAGRYGHRGMTVYVNRGIGMEGGMAPRVRFLAPPRGDPAPDQTRPPSRRV